MESIQLKVDRKKPMNYSREDLLNFSKEELADLVIQIQANNVQLKNIISKSQKFECSERTGKRRPFDFSRFQTRRIKLRIAYLGANYKGLAVQEDCLDTIEAHLFNALVKSCLIKSREESFYHRCGRTDKGVSASGQVISIQVRSRLSAEELSSTKNGFVKELQYCKILNRLLPDDIRAISWAPAPLAPNGEYYSARFDCKQRTYKYWFPKGSFNIVKMREACKYLIGTHDFRNLCKMDVANGVTEFIRDLTHASIVKENANSENEEGYDMYYLLIKANAFLWHQIRCIAGILFLIGKGDEEPEILLQLLNVNANPRKPQYSMAIDIPLNLFHCDYEFLNDYHITENLKSVEVESVCDVDQTHVSNMAEMKMEPPNEVEAKKISWLVDLQDLELVIRSFQMQWSKTAIKASMIKDIVNDLEALYISSQSKIDCDKPLNTDRKDIFSYQSDCVLEGVKPKIYQPLMKRVQCESLENRIEHYLKKKRLKKVNQTDDNMYENV